MRLLSSRTFFAALCLAALAAEAGAAQQRPRKLAAPPPAVQKVYVGDMGYEDEAERFRLLVEEQLQKRDFEVVLDPADADAVLTGVLTVRNYEHKSEARVTVRLTSRDGAVLLTRDFGHKRFSVNPLSLQEPTRRRAEEVAEALKREFRKPAKKSP
jgi:hypothetical protein